MDKEIQKQLLERSSGFIDKASQTLGQTAAHVYEVLVKQQFVEGIGSLVSIALFGVVFIAGMKWYIDLVKKPWKEDSDDQFPIVLLGLVIAGVGGLVLGFAVGEVSIAIQKLINPEFFAIKFIFETAKGVK